MDIMYEEYDAEKCGACQYQVIDLKWVAPL